MRHFLVLGTHPLLSLAEARAVLGGDKPEIIDNIAIFCAKGASASGGEREDWDGAWLQDRLAGTVKLGDIVADISLKQLSPERLADLIEQHPRAERILFGLTLLGEGQSRFNKLALQLKKELKARGKASRWVTGDEGEIATAAVSKLKLTTEGYDFVIALTRNRAYVGLTAQIQNIDAWSRRDFGRPFRDPATGMLPPKLARLMVNLGVTHHALRITQHQTILDPFCGGGTILMEAALMKTGPLIGSDIDPRQVEGSKKNLDWLVVNGLIDQTTRTQIRLLTHPAESIDSKLENPVDAVVTEGFLGKPLQGNEPLAFLEKSKREIEALWIASLKSFAKILKPGGRIVAVWPVFTVSAKGGCASGAKICTVAVDLKNKIHELGYRLMNPLEGWTSKPATLTYSRPDQHVKRNIVILEKI